MTTIVAYIAGDSTYMACDSIVSSDHHREEVKTPKVIEVKNTDGTPLLLMGVAGSSSVYAKIFTWKQSGLDMSHSHFANYTSVLLWANTHLKTFLEGTEEDFQLLIATNTIYKIYTNYYVSEVKCGYDAIGKDFPFAIGSMFSDKQTGEDPITTVQRAIDAASVHGSHTGGEIKVFRI